MSHFVEIDPFAIIKTVNIVGFRIDTIQVNLFNDATIRVILFDAPNSIHDIKNIYLSKEEYNGWASDDNYIVELICQKLGFSQINNTQVQTNNESTSSTNVTPEQTNNESTNSTDIPPSV